MARLISRAELARLASVSAVAISKRCKKELAPACVGRRIDRDHPAVQAYLDFKAGGRTEPAKRARKSAAAPTVPRGGKAVSPPTEDLPVLPSQDVDDDIEGYAHLTLDQLVARFGTRTAFKDWLVARKTISDIREKDLRNDETEGRLIPREYVETHIFRFIDGQQLRLLRDAPKTSSRRSYALAKSAAPVEEAERNIREIISSHLHAVKTAAQRVLRNA